MSEREKTQDAARQEAPRAQPWIGGAQIALQPWVGAQSAAMAAIGRPIGEASKPVFDFLRGDAPAAAKYEVVAAYAKAYAKGNAALSDFFFHASTEFGFSYSGSLPEMQKKDPARFSYMQALAYGFAKFGADGFKAAATLVERMDLTRQVAQIPVISTRESSLAAPFAVMVCTSLHQGGKINPAGAVAYLKSYLYREDLSLHTRAAFLNLVRVFDAGALEGLVRDPKLDGQLRETIGQMPR